MQIQDFQTAQSMAQTWVQQRTDHNEIAKALRYLVEHESGPQFFTYLRTVVNDGRAVVRSGRTLDYYKQIERVCRQHLDRYKNDPKTMAQVLGWAVRLMRYYRVESSLPRPPRVTPARPKKPKDKPAEGRRQGRVRWFNQARGYGFIEELDSDNEWFFHHSQLAEELKPPAERTPVTFTIGKGPRGRDQAQDVQPA